MKKIDTFKTLTVRREEEDKIRFSLDGNGYLAVPATWPVKKVIRALFKHIHDISWNWTWRGTTIVHYHIHGIPVGELRRFLTPKPKARWEPLLGRRVFGQPCALEECAFIVEIKYLKEAL